VKLSRRDREKIAFERIEILMQLVLKHWDKNEDLSRRWITLARNIAKKVRKPFPKKYNQIICRKCNTLLIPGKTCRIRIRNNKQTHITITCLNCGHIKRKYIKK